MRSQRKEVYNTQPLRQPGVLEGLPNPEVFSGSLPQCADRLQEIYDEYTEAGNTVTDYRDDPVDGDKLKEQVMNGWFTAMHVDNPTNEYFTLMEV